mmetsp:Transcript_25970/g.73054  ORF Transcript_25970/g.73054 Transcript_25970/m.73054 type:complete len:253 (+) Transcript_25970:70-828(+)
MAAATDALTPSAAVVCPQALPRRQHPPGSAAPQCKLARTPALACAPKLPSALPKWPRRGRPILVPRLRRFLPQLWQPRVCNHAIAAPRRHDGSREAPRQTCPPISKSSDHLEVQPATSSPATLCALPARASPRATARPNHRISDPCSSTAPAGCRFGEFLRRPQRERLSPQNSDCSRLDIGQLLLVCLLRPAPVPGAAWAAERLWMAPKSGVRRTQPHIVLSLYFQRDQRREGCCRQLCLIARRPFRWRQRR